VPQATLSPATIVARNSGFMEAEVDQEIVALDVEKGVYYGLNPVGSRIWRLLINPIRIADICTVLVTEYQVEPETCEREVLNLLEDLRAEGMISTQGDAGSELTAKGRN
jgi:hypothetical protein